MTTKRNALLLSLTCAGAILTACGGSSDDPPAASTKSAQAVCTELSGASIGGASSLTTTMVASTATVPSYCKVSGVLLPKLNFELRVPDAWNGKLYYQGGGGFDGSIPAVSALTIQSLKSGYFNVTSDGGHQGGAADGSAFLNDPYAAELWGSLSVPTVTAFALEVIKSVYGQSPTQSCFEGGSNGGREGMMAMRRNPNLFDGVVIRAPAYNIVGFFGHWNMNNKALSAPGASLSNAKVATLAKAVRDRCDSLDGLVDGVVSNPRACNSVFDPVVLRCAGGADTGDSCLSDPQLAAIRVISSPATFGDATNSYVDAGMPFSGNEDEPGAWPLWISGNGNVKTTLSFALTDSAVKYFIARDPNVDSLTYAPYDQDLNSLFALSTLSDATSPDIRPFVNAGGKVIISHGGNDSAFAAESTAVYYNGVVNALGGRANADNSVRFYTTPGVNHTTGGPGADTTDLLAAIDNWVVNKQAPTAMTARKLDANGATLFERPLCTYPQYPRYTGPANDSAAAKLATSFTCTTP